MLCKSCGYVVEYGLYGDTCRSCKRALKGNGNQPVSAAAVEPVELRLFDSQWLNIVNAHGQTIDGAVKATEAAMRENITKGWPRPRAASATPEAVTDERLGKFQIEMEKELCDLLGRPWATSGFSLETLLADLRRKLAASTAASAACPAATDPEPTAYLFHGNPDDCFLVWPNDAENFRADGYIEKPLYLSPPPSTGSDGQDARRLDYMIQSGDHFGHARDGENCWLMYMDDDGDMHSRGLFDSGRKAIDAAMARAGEGKSS